MVNNASLGHVGSGIQCESALESFGMALVVAALVLEVIPALKFVNLVEGQVEGEDASSIVPDFVIQSLGDLTAVSSGPESSRVICENHSCKSSPSLIFFFSHGSESKSRNQ